jgi:uncharacterized protein
MSDGQEPEDETAVFFDRAAEGQVVLRRCGSCGAHAWPVPWQRFCRCCLSFDTEWVSASGAGTLVSAVWIHQRYDRSVEHRLPYPVGVVDLAEGARTARVGLIAQDPSAVRGGVPVLVRFLPAECGLILPWFAISER